MEVEVEAIPLRMHQGRNDGVRERLENGFRIKG